MPFKTEKEVVKNGFELTMRDPIQISNGTPPDDATIIAEKVQFLDFNTLYTCVNDILEERGMSIARSSLVNSFHKRDLKNAGCVRKSIYLRKVKYRVQQITIENIIGEATEEETEQS